MTSEPQPLEIPPPEAPSLPSPAPAVGRPAGTRRPILFGLAGVGAIAAAALASSAGRPTASPAVAGERKDVPFLDGGLIRFSETFARRAGVSSTRAAAGDLTPVVNVTGTVTFDGRAYAAAGARIPGRVRRVFKVVGDRVRPREAVAEIESAELGRAEALVAAARAREVAAEANMKRERRLADERISSEREAQVAHAEWEAARAERTASERAVQALGGDLQGEIGILVLRSPIAGHVVRSKATRGQVVEASTTLFEVADLASLWVELEVFERDLSAVSVGDRVELACSAAPGRSLAGRVAHVGQVIDEETRSAPVRVEVDNGDRLLRPGQSVHARVHTSAPARRLLSVPRAAVTRIDGRPTVLVLRGQGVVEPRAVILGPDDGQRVAVEGLDESTEVVVEGLFALKSEIFR